MNNIKKLGLTALAGSLVATSAYAGSLDVAGGASITYKSNDETEVNGNGFSMGDGITFSGSGDLDLTGQRAPQSTNRRLGSSAAGMIAMTS